jgi:hypothetical protein
VTANMRGFAAAMFAVRVGPLAAGYSSVVSELPSVEEQLKEIGAQLDWVRDYL